MIMSYSKPIISIENVVASATIDQSLDLKDVTKKFPDVEWHLEQFAVNNLHSMLDEKNLMNYD